MYKKRSNKNLFKEHEHQQKKISFRRLSFGESSEIAEEC